MTPRLIQALSGIRSEDEPPCFRGKHSHCHSSQHLLLPRSTGLAFMLLELRRWEKETGEKVYLYDSTMQFEGYTGEICKDDYTRVVDTTFPDVDNSFWSVGVG